MKKLFAAILCVSVLLCFVPAVFAEDVFGAPKVQYLGADTDTENYAYLFSLDTGDAAGYERERRQVYDRLHAQYTDEQLIAAGEGWVTYPTVLQIHIQTGGYTALLGAYSVLEDSLRLSLGGDILPALVRTGLYKHTRTKFSLYFSIALGSETDAAAVSPEAAVEGLVYPATAHITYKLEEDVQNPNPTFIVLPYDTRTLAYPKRQGYTFAGWYNTDTNAYVGALPANTLEMTLDARWTPRTYKINYVLTTRQGMFIYVDNSGNPTARTYGADTELFSVIPPYGYLFGGWYLTEDLSGEAVTSIPGDVTGDLILYAKWLTEEERQNEVVAAGQWGDLNSDGKVTAADARLALRAAVKLDTLSPELLKRVDFIGNGIVNAGTARQLLRVAVGLETMYGVLEYYELV